MLAMYLLGIVVALLMAWLFKKTLLQRRHPPPHHGTASLQKAGGQESSSAICGTGPSSFLRRAGTVILGISILLWFLATYPTQPAVEREFAANARRLKRRQLRRLARGRSRQRRQRRSTCKGRSRGEAARQFCGCIGRGLEPVIAPLGFDWKLGLDWWHRLRRARCSSAPCRRFTTSASMRNRTENTRSLAQTLREQVRPDGRTLYTPLMAITFMVFYVFALQCVSTVAIVRRETNSWKWPLFQWAYMGALAWLFAFVTYQGGGCSGFNRLRQKLASDVDLYKLTSPWCLMNRTVSDQRSTNNRGASVCTTLARAS